MPFTSSTASSRALTSFAVRPESALRDDQRLIARYILERDYGLIVAPMGRGKSGAALTAIKRMLDCFDARKVLIVAPLRVASDTWPEEIKAWEHTRIVSHAVCVGSPEKRAAALARDAEITIINRENLPWLWEQTGSGRRWPFDTVVVDESSMFKAGKRRTGKRKLTRFAVLASARKMIERIYLLTGTPSPGGLQDLWGQIYLLDLGQRLGSNRSAFLDRWFDQNPWSYRITPRPHAEKEIMSAISDVMISLPPLDLVAPPVFVPVKVKIQPKVMKEYIQFERTLVSEAYDVEAVSAGVLTNKLLQFANGSMYRNDGDPVEVHTEKLDALDELIERAAGDPVLVFYGFRFDLDAIRKRHPEAVVLNESDTAVSDWNAGKIKILLAHPASCAHGLNLQYGGHICVWYGLTWSLELYQQANARLARPGQRNLVVIYQIIAEGTVDETVLAVLDSKAAVQDSVVDAVKIRFVSVDRA